MAAKLISLYLLGIQAISLKFIEGVDIDDDPILNNQVLDAAQQEEDPTDQVPKENEFVDTYDSCENIDLGDPFEDYSHAGIDFDYGQGTSKTD